MRIDKWMQMRTTLFITSSSFWNQRSAQKAPLKEEEEGLLCCKFKSILHFSLFLSNGSTTISNTISNFNIFGDGETQLPKKQQQQQSQLVIARFQRKMMMAKNKKVGEMWNNQKGGNQKKERKMRRAKIAATAAAVILLCCCDDFWLENELKLIYWW